MHIKHLGFVVLADDVKKASEFYTTHFGFRANVLLSWYANHEHPDYKGVFLDLIKRGHESAGEALANSSTNGTLVAFVVDDVEAEYKRLAAAGLDIIMDIQAEPWGQKRFQIRAPDNVVVEIIQLTQPDMEWLQAHP